MRVQAAQQQAADSASAAASARSEEKALQVKQQVVSLQQELSDVKKAKQGLEAQLAHESDERMKSSEELGRAAKAMLRAQVSTRTSCQFHVTSSLKANSACVS